MIVSLITTAGMFIAARIPDPAVSKHSSKSIIESIELRMVFNLMSTRCRFHAIVLANQNAE